MLGSVRRRKEKEEQLRQELCDYIDAHPCSPAVPARAALPSVAVPLAAASLPLEASLLPTIEACLPVSLCSTQ